MTNENNDPLDKIEIKTTLTEAELDRLAEKLFQKSIQEGKMHEQFADILLKKMEERIFLNTGKGLWNLAWKGIVLIVIAIAVYGATHGYWG